MANIPNTKLTWQIDSGVLSIEVDTSSSSTNTNIPDYSATNPPWNDSISSITSITIGSGVSSIGKYAFSGCRYATSVSIPNTTPIILVIITTHNIHKI